MNGNVFVQSTEIKKIKPASDMPVVSNDLVDIQTTKFIRFKLIVAN